MWSYIKERISSTLEDKGVGGVAYNDIDEIGWGFRIALLYGLFYFFLLIYLITKDTITLTQSKYLSLSSNNDIQECDVVPQSITATFEGSFEGYWNTNPNFKKNSSLYVLELSGASLTNEEYTQIISSFQDSLHDIGTKAANRSALWSLIVWSTFAYNAKDSSVTFYSNADAGVIFNLKSYVATLSSRYGNCPNQMLSGSFDVSNKRLSITFPLNNTALKNFIYRNQTYFFDDDIFGGSTRPTIKYLEPCPNQGSFVDSGFLLPQTWMDERTGFFDLSFDVRSVVLALALNLNLLNASTLVKSTTKASLSFHSYLYIEIGISPPMNPIICLNKVDPFWKLNQEQINGPEICFIYQGVDQNLWFAYPMMISLNSNFSGSCNCPENIDDYNCNVIDYIVGLMYDLTFDFYDLVNNVAIKMQDIMIKDPENGDVTVVNTLTPILTNAILLQYDYLHRGYNTAGVAEREKDIQKAYDQICPSCGTAVLELYGIDFPYFNKIILSMNENGIELSELSNKTVLYEDVPVCNPPNSKNCTTQNVSLPQFMCIDSFSQPLALSRLASTPPVPLIQNYYECQLRTKTAFQRSIGIASGSATLYTSIFTIVFGFLFIKYMKHINKISLCSKRTNNKKKELYDEQIKRNHIKEMDALKTIIIELSEALILTSSDSTKAKLNRSLLELKNTILNDTKLSISNERVSRIEGDINPMYIEKGTIN